MDLPLATPANRLGGLDSVHQEHEALAAVLAKLAAMPVQVGTQARAEVVTLPDRPTARGIRDRLGELATVVGLGEEVTMADLVDDLGDRGVRALLVEGGRTMITQFLASDLVDELQLAIAPFFVGDPRAPRLIGDGTFPWTPERHAVLAESRQVGDMVLLRYALSERCVTRS